MVANQYTGMHDPDRVDIWLREALSNGEVESRVVKTLAAASGVTGANLRSSRRRLHVVVRRTNERSSKTVWSLPPDVDVDTSEPAGATDTSTGGDTSNGVEPFLDRRPARIVGEELELIPGDGRAWPLCVRCRTPVGTRRVRDRVPQHAEGECPE
jgi:hypothetical protein